MGFRGNRGEDNLVLLMKIDGCRDAENQVSSAFKILLWSQLPTPHFPISFYFHFLPFSMPTNLSPILEITCNTNLYINWVITHKFESILLFN